MMICGDQALIAVSGESLADQISLAREFLVAALDPYPLICEAANKLVCEKQHVIGVARDTSNRCAVLGIDYALDWNFLDSSLQQ